MFSIHSAASDRALIFSSYDGDHFQVELKGNKLSASTGVWINQNVDGLDIFFQELATFKKPWQGERKWESIEGEIEISATCTTLGHVIFQVKLSGSPTESEAWEIEAGIQSELGQLERIAKESYAFFQVDSPYR